jgi:rubrerythrin
MELKKLQKHVRTLAILEETNAPVISCYLNLEKGASGYRNILDKRVDLLRKSLKGDKSIHFEEALKRIEDFIATELFADAKGAVIFSRGGSQPFFLPLQFRVPLPNWFVMDTVPNIYHLIEVNLGSITEKVWRERPELRKRVGREWTKEHYQSHKKGRIDQFIKEKIKILDKLLSAGGYSHLILAGDPRMNSRIRNAIPKHIRAKIIDTVVTSARDRISDVVAATLSSFVEQEEFESQAMADRLEQEVNTHGLAEVGTDACLKALQRGQVDVLVLAESYNPDPGWKCAACGAIGGNDSQPKACPICEKKEVQELNVKEEMVRMAEQYRGQVEIVKYSEVLMEFGGVGCLLRYRMSEQYC